MLLLSVVVVVVLAIIIVATIKICLRQKTTTTKTITTATGQEIPKIIHQIALEPRARPSTWPASWKRCHASWKRLHPDFDIKLWTDRDLDDFMRTTYPAHHRMYRSYDGYIKRADAARYFLLHHYGGVYADMDYECLNRFHDALPEGKVSVVQSPWDNGELYQNSLMASPPGHPFWTEVLVPMLVDRSVSKKCTDVYSCTGPWLLRDAVAQAPEGSVHVLERDLYSGQGENEVVTDEHRRTAYAVHYGTGTWIGKAST